MPEQPRVPEVDRGGCGDESAAQLILQRRKQAQRDDVTCPRPRSKLMGEHLLEPWFPLPHWCSLHSTQEVLL